MNTIRQQIFKLFDVLKNQDLKDFRAYLLPSGEYDAPALSQLLLECIAVGYSYNCDCGYKYSTEELSSIPGEIINREALAFAKSLGPNAASNL